MWNVILLCLQQTSVMCTTVKTFLFWQRSGLKVCKIALATASSGIAATLTGSCTLHSMFKIPLGLNAMDIPVCIIKRGTARCKVIQEAVIVVNEASMTNRHAFEALDRTLRDLNGNDHPMGGICAQHLLEVCTLL